jgi:putative flippase GtrA
MPAESIGGDVQRSIVQQATSYVVVGGVNTVLSLGLLWLFYRSGLPYPIYTTLVYCTMIFVSFELNRRFAFAASPRSRGQYRQWLIRFCVLHVCNLTIIQLLQAFMIEKAEIPQYGAVVVAALVGMVIGFLGSRAIFDTARSALRSDDGQTR